MGPGSGSGRISRMEAIRMGRIDKENYYLDIAQAALERSTWNCPL